MTLVFLGPGELRKGGLITELKNLNCDVNDHGDIDVSKYGEIEPFTNQTVQVHFLSSHYKC